MPRAAKLRRKGGHWFTQAGGRGGAYFGRVDEVPYAEAKRLFGEFLASQKYQERREKLPAQSVAEVCNAHLDYIQGERSPALFGQRKCLLNVLCNHRVDDWRDRRLPGKGQLLGRLRALQLTRAHVEEFLQWRR